VHANSTLEARTLDPAWPSGGIEGRLAWVDSETRRVAVGKVAQGIARSASLAGSKDAVVVVVVAVADLTAVIVVLGLLLL